MSKSHSNRGRKFPVEILTDEEVQRLLRACSHRARAGIRNRALIVLLYRGGLRCAEALALFPKDLDARAGTGRILNGKGQKARTVGLDPASFALISRWFDVRTKMGINGRAPLFCTLTGGPISTAYVRGLLKRLGRKAGIEKRVQPHGLRHTMAAQLASEGVPMNVIQAQLGHSSLATTSRYLDHIAPAELVEAMQRREWRLK